MKKCPFCAEDILDGAIKCKHCGSMLDSSSSSDSRVAQGDRGGSFSMLGLLGALLAIIGVVLGFIGAVTNWLIAIPGIVLLVVGAGLGAKYK